ncbi:MAG TPA: TolC family protein [Puia sp.]|nr:TolC family protein [Puia sp.]
MKKKHILYVGVAILLSFTKTQAQNNSGAGTPDIGTSLSLQQAVSVAIRNNLVVNQADIQAQISKVTLNQSWGNMLPSISASASQGIGFGRSLITSSYTYTDQQTASGSYQANAGLTLFNGLTLQNTVKANQYTYAASKMDLQQQKDNITLNVYLAYLLVLSSQDLLNIAREQADIDVKQADRLETQNKEGALLLLSNLTDLRGQYAGDQANIAIAVNNLEAAKVGLFQIMNVPYKRDVEYDRAAFTLQLNDYQQSPDSIYMTAMQILPSIKSADLRIKSFEKALRAARGQYYPNLSFYANVNSYYSNAATQSIPSNSFANDTTANYVSVGGNPYNVINKNQIFNTSNTSWGDQFKNNRQTSIGLQINIPILNYLRARNGVKQAKINLRNSEIVSNSTRLALQQSVELAYQNMIAGYKQYKSYMDQAAAYAESFRVAEIRFNEGVINSDIYIIAKNNADRANTSLSQAKYNYILRTKVLDYYQGRLNP